MKKLVKGFCLFALIVGGKAWAEEKKSEPEKKQEKKSVESSSKVDLSQAPTLKISGTTAISTGVVNQRVKKGGKGGGTPSIGIGLSDIYFTVTGESSGGLIYRWRMNITTVPGVIAIDRNFIELGSTNVGTFQVGAAVGVEDSMAQTAVRLVGGAAGIDGMFAGFYNMSSGNIGVIHPIGYTKRATKAVYTTPRIEGFQFGVAYTPHTGHSGRQGRNLEKAETEGVGHDSGLFADRKFAPHGVNNIAAAVSYANAWDDFSLNLALTYVHENSKPSIETKNMALHNASSYQIGTTIGYKDVRVATSYMNNGKSRLPKFADQELIKADSNKNKPAITTQTMHLGNAGRIWDIGAQYTMNQYKFALAYFNTERKFDHNNKAKAKIVTFTTDYNFLPGLSFFGEIDVASSKTTQTIVNHTESLKSGSGINNNSGRAVIVGTKISF